MMTSDDLQKITLAAQEAVDSRGLSGEELSNELTLNWRKRIQLEIEWGIMYKKLKESQCLST